MRNIVSVWSEVLVDMSDIDDESMIDELEARGYQVIPPEDQGFEEDDVETDFDDGEEGAIGHA